MLCFGFDVSLDFEIQVSNPLTLQLLFLAVVEMVLVALHYGGSLLPLSLSAFVFFLQGQHFSTLSSQEPFSGGLLSWKSESGQLGCRGPDWHMTRCTRKAGTKPAPSHQFCATVFRRIPSRRFRLPLSPLLQISTPISNGLGSHGRQIFLDGSPRGITPPSLQTRNHVTRKPLS